MKIGDLGSAVEMDQKYQIEGFSRWYKAPELMMGMKNYKNEIDLWSYGCVIGELMKGIPIFSGINEIDQLSRIAKVLGCPCEYHWKSIVSMPDFGKISFNYTETTGLTLSCMQKIEERNECERFLQHYLKYEHRNYHLDDKFFDAVREKP